MSNSNSQPKNREELREAFRRDNISFGLSKNNDSRIVYGIDDGVGALGMTRSITEDEMYTDDQRIKADGIPQVKRGKFKLPSPTTQNTSTQTSPPVKKGKKRKARSPQTKKKKSKHNKGGRRSRRRRRKKRTRRRRKSRRKSRRKRKR